MRAASTQNLLKLHDQFIQNIEVLFAIAFYLLQFKFQERSVMSEGKCWDPGKVKTYGIERNSMDWGAQVAKYARAERYSNEKLAFFQSRGKELTYAFCSVATRVRYYNCNTSVPVFHNPTNMVMGRSIRRLWTTVRDIIATWVCGEVGAL